MKKSKASKVQPKKPARKALRELARCSGVKARVAVLIWLRARLRPNCGLATASATRATWTISATSCTRTMCAPPRMLAVTVAAVPQMRSASARTRREPWPMNLFRDVPTQQRESQAARVPAGARANRNFARQLLPKPMPGSRTICDFGDAGAAGDGDGAAQAGGDVAQHVARERRFLHGARFAAHVHQDQRQLAPGGEFREARVGAERGDVVEDFGARHQRRLRRLRICWCRRRWEL